MKETISTIFQVANTISPLGVIALCVFAIISQKKDGGFSLIKITRSDKSKEEKKSKDENEEKEDSSITLTTISKRIEKIANNHLHDLPAMKEALDRIERKQDSQGTEQVRQGERLASVERAVDILLK